MNEGKFEVKGRGKTRAEKVIAENAEHYPKSHLSNQRWGGKGQMTSTTQDELGSLFWCIKMTQRVCQKRRCSPDSAIENVGIILEGDLPVVYDGPQVVPDEFVDIFWVPLTCIEVVSKEFLIDREAWVDEVWLTFLEVREFVW